MHKKKRELTHKAIDLVLSAAFSSKKTTIKAIPNLCIYYDKLEDGKFKNLVIQKVTAKEKRRKGSRKNKKNRKAKVQKPQWVIQEIFANFGSLLYNKELGSLTFKLEEGSSVSIKRDKEGTVKEEHRFHFREMSIPVFLEDKNYVGDRAKYLPFDRLWQRLHNYRAQIKALGRKNKKNRSKRDFLKEEVNICYVELFQRLAISFSPLVIILIGAPLGIIVRHSNKLVAFGVSSLPIILVYYPLMNWGRTLANKGSLDPFIATWMCNFVAGGIGIGLIFYVFRK